MTLRRRAYNYLAMDWFGLSQFIFRYQWGRTKMPLDAIGPTSDQSEQRNNFSNLDLHHTRSLDCDWPKTG